MAASIELIQKLRAQTGAGIVDCKKTLEENGGDFDKALDELRKKGSAKVAKRADRETKEGTIKIALSEDGATAFMLEANAETDFVVRNEKFQDFVEKIWELVKTQEPADREALLNLKFEDGTVAGALENLSAILGEKLNLKNCAVVKNAGTLATYSHLGGKIGVIVTLSKAGLDEVAHDVAMQIAALNPSYLTPEEVPAEIVAKEKEIYTAQLLAEGKPEAMIEKIMVGKLNKFYEEICLLKQICIKDDKMTVEQLLKNADGEVKVVKFVRFSLA